MSAEDRRITPQDVINSYSGQVVATALRENELMGEAARVREQIATLQTRLDDLAVQSEAGTTNVVSEFYRLAQTALEQRNPRVALFYTLLATEIDGPEPFDYTDFLQRNPSFTDIDLGGLVPSWVQVVEGVEVAAGPEPDSDVDTSSVGTEEGRDDSGDEQPDQSVTTQAIRQAILDRGVVNAAGKVAISDVRGLAGGKQAYLALRAQAEEAGVEIDSPRGRYAALPIEQVVALLAFSEQEQTIQEEIVADPVAVEEAVAPEVKTEQPRRGRKKKA